MLATPKQNQLRDISIAVTVGLAFVALGFAKPMCVTGVLAAPLVYWVLRRRVKRRLHVMTQPFPQEWENILRQRVAYYNSLDESGRDRFRRMVLVFVDETRITGIRTDVDDTTRVLVASSAIIPIFNFPDWEYSALGEVLIYPGSFDESYQSHADSNGDLLGMVGEGHLRGVMILSKPSLIAGFDITGDGNNVGIHEFAHLVDKADGSIDGLPPGVPRELSRRWIEWVGKELAGPRDGHSHINPYAYTNESEYYAVLTEYFFEAPAKLKQKDPTLYDMLQQMFRQDTASFMKRKWCKPRRVARNADCPCGSGEKFKRCCGSAASSDFSG